MCFMPVPSRTRLTSRVATKPIRQDKTRRKTGLDGRKLSRVHAGFPIPLEEKSKDEMRHAIRNDSKFLRDAEIVDYSVLVGLNEKNSSE